MFVRTRPSASFGGLTRIGSIPDQESFVKGRINQFFDADE